MTDDLSKLTPTDPSAVDPDWSENRKGILDDVLGDSTERRRGIGRWVAGAAAAALVAVAVGGAVQQLRPEPYATPAASPPASTSALPTDPPASSSPPSPSPSAASSSPPTPPIVADGEPVAIQGSHVEVNGTFGVCYGSVSMGDGDEASCDGGFLPVEGMTLAEAGEAPALTVGRWDGSVFRGARSYRYDDPDSPVSQFAETPPAKPDICEEKTGTGSSVDFDELWARAEQLPGFQDLWIPDDEPMDHAQVAVTDGVEEAQDALLSEFGFSLCVGSVPGPDAATLDEAEAAIAELWPRALGELEPYVLTTSQVEGGGNTLTVLVLDASDEITSRLRNAVAPDVWPYTTVKSALVPVDADALEPSEDD